MLTSKAIKRRGIGSGGVMFLLSVSFFPLANAVPIGSTVVLQSKATDNYVATWDNADPRTEISVIDAGEGFVALKSMDVNKFWSLSGNGSDQRLYCSSTDMTRAEPFAWIENADNTISLKSKSNNMYLSVVEKDTTIVPDYSSIPTDGSSHVVVTPQMRLPFIAKAFVLHASAVEIGSQEKFQASSFALKKQTNLTPTNSKVLSFMYSQMGKKTMSGIHNKEPNTLPTQYTNWMYSLAGVYPAYWDADFQFGATDQANRAIMIDSGIAQWKKCAMIGLMYHMCSPITTESCAWDPGVGHSGSGTSDKPSSAQWTQLVTDNTPLNDTLKLRLKHIAPYFQQLQAQGIEVLFKIFHEMNQGFFWWGGNTGATGTSRLFQIAHDYMTDSLGLTNIIWVWDVQDLDFTWSQYNPGSQYWDIMAVDMYSMGYTTTLYNNALDIAGTKPLGIGECYTIPTAAQLASQPRWSYFCSWADGTVTTNIKSVYTASNVISLNSMPCWGTTANEPQSLMQTGSGKSPVFVNASTGQVRFTALENGHLKISLHNAKGQLVATIVEGEYSAGPHTEHCAAGRAFSPGIYFVRLVTKDNESFQKITVVK
jgi:mannan endo-1,4-beta-mannosidase